MSMQHALPRASHTARAEASAWIAKLHGPGRSIELERDFRRWLNADPDHALAFEQVTKMWEAIEQVNVEELPRLPAVDELPRTRRIGLQLPAVACALVVVATAWLLFKSQSYATHIGEQRLVTLEDGSRLHLNSDTRLTVDLDDHMRHVQVERGEAFFEVAKDAGRPFVVAVGDRIVTALGTAFVVRLQREQVAVTLVEGKISVVPAGSAESLPLSSPQGAGARVSSDDAVVLASGERLIVSSRGPAMIDTPRTEFAAAWRHGEIILDHTPLQSAAAELNRYQRRQLVLEDPRLDALPVSGIYRIGSPEDFAQAVALLYDLEVIEDGNEIRLHRER